MEEIHLPSPFNMNYKIAIDWSHNKGLTIFDGKDINVLERKKLLNIISNRVGGGESNEPIKSMEEIQPSPTPNTVVVYVEQGCPLYLQYDIIKSGASINLIDSHDVCRYREQYNICKTDANDAEIIYKIGSGNDGFKHYVVNQELLELHGLYHQFRLYQKARLMIYNVKLGHIKSYGEFDTSVYDECVTLLKKKEVSIVKDLEKRIDVIKRIPNIKGLGRNLWVGILITANPIYFPCLSAYLRYCGLVDLKLLRGITSKGKTFRKFNRHANKLYRLLADSVMIWKDGQFRPLYDKLKVDMAKKYEGERKFRINKAALNRLATFLAKSIYYYMKDVEFHINIKPVITWHEYHIRRCSKCGNEARIKFPKYNKPTPCKNCKDNTMELVYE